MKVSGPPQGASARHSAKTGRTRPASPLASGTAEASRATSDVAPAGIQDVVELAGLSEADLTPKVRGALLMLLGEVQRLREELDRSHQRVAQLEALSDQDALLPLINRRAFVRELSRYLAFAERYGAPGSVIYLDLDDMKRVNDRYGHAAGDALLKHVSGLVLASVRGSDIVGRLGGDELGIILVNAERTNAERKATDLAERIARTPLLWEGAEVGVSVSWGVYAFTGNEDVDETLRAADEAMYANKRARL